MVIVWATGRDDDQDGQPLSRCVDVGATWAGGGSPYSPEHAPLVSLVHPGNGRACLM